jgi:tRNA dimethylallyltransferase
MLPPPFDRCLVLTGPTGSGKSRLALALAEQLGAEIVSMDSMALYRGLDICTAKPSRAERQHVPHHLLDVLDPWEPSSVAWWLDRARECVANIQGRGRRVLFVGGTPLYLKALRHGLFDGPAADAEVRRRLEAEAAREGSSTLHQRLAVVDPVSASRLHPNDTRRLVRALEVFETTGRPLSAWQQQWNTPLTPAPTTDGIAPEERCLWLERPREELYARIDLRVRQMIAEGLVEEIRAVRTHPRGISKQAGQALGIEELAAFLDGRQELEQAIALLQQRTRNFAKRQLTWFRQMRFVKPTTEDLTFARWHLTIHSLDERGMSRPAPSSA